MPTACARCGEVTRPWPAREVEPRRSRRPEITPLDEVKRQVERFADLMVEFADEGESRSSTAEGARAPTPAPLEAGEVG